MPRNPNVMGYHFPLNTRAVSSSFPLFFFSSCCLSFFPVTNPSFFELQSTIQEHEKLVGWLGISSWGWPIIQGACTALERRPTRAVVVVVMMMVVVIRRIQRRLLAIDQGRDDTINYLQSRHITIQHTYFFLLLLLLFFISFSRHLNSFCGKGLYLTNIFLNLCF